MKKISFLLLVAIVVTSCAVGTYLPNAENRFGAQTTVVLDKANFRVVRDVEAVVAVNNTNLSRADVENSAYGELLRNAQLTGSQVLINVVIEEIRRESMGILRALVGLPKRVQYVAARATIIEFLDENRNPRTSSTYSPQETTQTNFNFSQQTTSQSTIESKNVVNTSVQEQKMASREDQEKLKRMNHQLEKLVDILQSQNIFVYKVFNIYKKIYESTNESTRKTEQNVQELQNIQSVLSIYFTTRTNAYPNLEKDLQKASSIEEQKAILLSYHK